MTYGELLLRLRSLSGSQLNCDVTVKLAISDECIPVDDFGVVGEEQDVLDNHHPVLYVDF